MRALVVVSIDLPTPEDVVAVIDGINPPSVPHFAGDLRVVVDPIASQLTAWLDEEEP